MVSLLTAEESFVYKDGKEKKRKLEKRSTQKSKSQGIEDVGREGVYCRLFCTLVCVSTARIHLSCV